MLLVQVMSSQLKMRVKDGSSMGHIPISWLQRSLVKPSTKINEKGMHAMNSGKGVKCWITRNLKNCTRILQLMIISTHLVLLL